MEFDGGEAVVVPMVGVVVAVERAAVSGGVLNQCFMQFAWPPWLQSGQVSQRMGSWELGSGSSGTEGSSVSFAVALFTATDASDIR